MLRQSTGSRQSADGTPAGGSSFARCSRLPSAETLLGFFPPSPLFLLPPPLPLQHHLLLQPNTHTHTHLTHTRFTFTASGRSLSIWNVCLLIGRHGEQFCGHKGVRACSKALERTGYTSTFLSLSLACLTLSLTVLNGGSSLLQGASGRSGISNSFFIASALLSC